MAVRRILKDKELRDKLISGIQKLTEIVSVTLGPKGSNVLINNITGSIPHVTNDGITVANAFNLEDQIENMAVNIVKSISSKTCMEAGDGTTTSIILADKMLRLGREAIDGKWYSKDINMQNFKEGMDKALIDVTELLKKYSKPVLSEDDVFKVATISANNDEVLGRIIADAYKEIGLKGVLTVEKAYSKNISVEVINGYKVEKGYSDRIFVNNPKEQTVFYKNAKVLICPEQLKYSKQLYDLFVKCSNDKQPLLIVCDDVDKTVYDILISSKDSLKSCIVGCPGISNYKAEVIEDFSIFIDAEKTFDNNMVGSCTSFKSDHEKTLVMSEVEGGRVRERIEVLKSRIDNKQPVFYSSVLWDRIGFLEGKMATLFIGANSDIEKDELWDRIDDATKAVKASIELGTVIGGGYTFYKLHNKMSTDNNNSSFRKGYELVRMSLLEPLKRICENSATDFKSVLINMNDGFIYDAKNNLYVAEEECNILDPVKVLLSSITNAVSVCSTVLTAKILLF